MKQMNKILAITTLVLACVLSSGCEDFRNELNTITSKTNGVKTMTVTISLDSNAATRALDSTGKKTFAEGDKIAVIYENSDSGALVKKQSEPLATKDLIENGKKAAFKVTLENAIENAPVRFIYPAAMAANEMPADSDPYDEATVNYNALSEQDGTLETLASKFDLAIFDGVFNELATLPDFVQLENQLAICEFTIKDNKGEDITHDISNLTVQIGSKAYKVIPLLANHIYVAMQPVEEGETFSFTATDGETTYLKSVSAKTLKAGNIYPVKMTMAGISSLIIGKVSDTEEELLQGGEGVDVLFGDKGIAKLAKKVADATGTDEASLTDNDILLYIFQHPDVVAHWAGAENSETDDYGDSTDSQEVLIGGPGSDILFAQGNDDILFSDASINTVVNWLKCNESFSDIENIINARDFSTLKAGLTNMETANDDGDMLFGGDGDDMLFGQGGNDILHGGNDDDMLYGGSGDDTLYGDAGDDYLDGGDGNDFLYGGTGTDILRFDAKDKIDGGEGIDILLGGSSDDSLYNLLNGGKISNVEIFLKLEGAGNIDDLNLTNLYKLRSVVSLYSEGDVYLMNPDELNEGYGWDLNISTTENGITIITYKGLYGDTVFTLTLETTLNVDVEEEIDQIILSLN